MLLQEDFWPEEAVVAEPLQEVPDLDSYDRIVVAFSGGKDSVACVLHLLDMGVCADRIHLHHHLVDGPESELMDWPVTEGYCNAFAKAFGMQISYSWREGGFEREMLRHDAATAPCNVPCGDGRKLIGGNGPCNTRRKFPQVTADLRTRWCSGSLKIDVFRSWLANDPQFQTGKTLVITGERAQESAGRAKYLKFEPHRSDNRCGRWVKRYVDHWRPVHAFTEEQVWDLIRKYRVVAHPSYWWGLSRASCRGCVFASKDQWATVKLYAPDQFKQISAYEKDFGFTINRELSVEAMAHAGKPFEVDPKWVEIANSREFTIPVITDDWQLPPGAFGEGSCGPT